jgi:hypothetical protein
MQQQAVRSPSTDWRLQQSFRRSFERLRGRAGDSYVGPETAQRTHDLRPGLSDTIDPRPRPLRSKVCKNFRRGIGIGGCTNSLDQSPAVSIASVRNICYDFFWAETWLREAIGASKRESTNRLWNAWWSARGQGGRAKFLLESPITH